MNVLELVGKAVGVLALVAVVGAILAFAVHLTLVP